MLAAAAAIAAPAILVLTVPRVTPAPAQIVLQTPPPVPPTELPPVEPVRLQNLTPDAAKAVNDAIPFASGKIHPALAFHLTGATDDQERALDCLSTGILYEAGDDTTGERAVAQVILNRVRHPAFPNSICGVVFQGSDRSTGCQFTFTCDGSLTRRFPQAAWDRARKVAQQALAGSVDKTVGESTHYHTNWVVPYWSASLDKVAAVGTHLFFRWTGWWGTPPAFRMRYAGAEPRIAELAAMFDVHKSADGSDPPTGTVDAAKVSNAALPSPTQVDANTFLVTLDPQFDPTTLSSLAMRSCAERAYCKFMAWSNPALTPKKLPLSDAAIEAMSFSYLRDRSHGYEKALWNCDWFKRADASQCMHRTARPRPKPTPEASFRLESFPSSVKQPVQEVPELSGIRRKPAPPVANGSAPSTTTVAPGDQR